MGCRKSFYIKTETGSLDADSITNLRQLLLAQASDTPDTHLPAVYRPSHVPTHMRTSPSLPPPLTPLFEENSSLLTSDAIGPGASERSPAGQESLTPQLQRLMDLFQRSGETGVKQGEVYCFPHLVPPLFDLRLK